MATDDDTYKSGELVDTEGGSLPTIPLPPAGVIKTALFTAFKYGSVARAYQAYEHALAAAADTNAAIAELHDSKIERDRSIATLRDAGKIHEADRLERERLWAGAGCLQQVQLADTFIERRFMPGWHPPQDLISTLGPAKPLPPVRENNLVRRLIRKIEERFHGLPNGHIHD